jgi:hypothetical protein
MSTNLLLDFGGFKLVVYIKMNMNIQFLKTLQSYVATLPLILFFLCLGFTLSCRGTKLAIQLCLFISPFVTSNLMNGILQLLNKKRNYSYQLLTLIEILFFLFGIIPSQRTMEKPVYNFRPC